MKKYTTDGPVTFHAGAILGLTAAQAKPRAHALTTLREGRYEVRTSVQFKAGEVIGYDDTPPKSLRDLLIAEKPAAARTAAA